MATINNIPQEDQSVTEEGATEKPQLTGDIMCDSCMDIPSVAFKSCLTCLVSYCESHLRPHLENVKFQNHRLVEPLHDIDCPICEVHCLPLDRVCLDHGFCICSSCETEVHKGHMTASLVEARAKIEIELQEKQVEITQSVSEAERALGKLQGNNDTVKTLVQNVSAAFEQQFSRLHNTVEEAKRTAIEVLDREQRQALRQSDSIQAHVEQRREELTKLQAQTNKLLRAKSNMEFLQKYSEWKKMSPDVSLPAVHIKNMEHLSSYVQTVTHTTKQLCELLLSSYKESMDKVFKSGYKAKPKDAEPSPLPLPVTREDFLRYQKSLTFDPDTIHNFLRVTEDHRKLTNTSPWQHSYVDNVSRFDYWRQALTSDSLYLGRHYIEADLSGEGAHIGVTYKSLGRKGEQVTSCICQSEYSWCIGRNSKGFSVWHAGVETPLHVTDITTVGLYIDFQKGQVSFYKVNDHFELLQSFEADILEPLYVVVWLSKKDNKVRLYDSNKTF
ncbi:tripartite motif-containing protein 16-like [Periophthalmus magnuspinnatus]|uniref:tripartite motif-containing protein 16-like n=1 Tax=Periophthalmus magnuspinnatus TaxID=409849 RepID=UPI00145BF38E|nr:tripartite motif-containing protein 16-like [Periophthalmus magnuspinnatus]